jgi:hypothetical protein
MSWVKLDDGFADHPKVAELSDAAFRMHVTALCWCARQETDGFISAKQARKIGAQRHVNELVGARLWIDQDDRFEIKDYLVYNPSREQLEAKRLATRERLQRFRGRDCNGVTDDVTDGDTDDVRNDVGTTSPDPLLDQPSSSGSGASSSLLLSEPKGSAGARVSKRPRKATGSPLPDPFPLTEKHEEYAGKKGWPRWWLENRHEQFCGLAQSKSWAYTDWDLAFFTFLRNELVYRRGPADMAHMAPGAPRSQSRGRAVQPSHGATGWESAEDPGKAAP